MFFAFSLTTMNMKTYNFLNDFENKVASINIKAYIQCCLLLKSCKMRKYDYKNVHSTKYIYIDPTI